MIRIIKDPVSFQRLDVVCLIDHAIGIEIDVDGGVFGCRYPNRATVLGIAWIRKAITRPPCHDKTGSEIVFRY